MNNKYKFVFFGSSDLSVTVLDELKSSGFLPTLIITTGDKPKGRKLILTPPEAKIWAEKEKIPFIQPKSLREDKNPEIVNEIKSFSPDGFDFFVVASYGKIIPQSILDIPKKGTLNVHPSLLPKLRGASPIKSAILNEDETGVSIMLLDADMDHGPILAQEKVISWDKENPPYEKDLKDILGKKGGKMLSEIIPDWINGKINPVEQNHTLATFCGKIEKVNGEINLEDNPELNLRKIRAFHMWPGAFYFQKHKDKNIRIVIKSAHIENGLLVIDSVIPEGKKEMSFKDFSRGLK